MNKCVVEQEDLPGAVRVTVADCNGKAGPPVGAELRLYCYTGSREGCAAFNDTESTTWEPDKNAEYRTATTDTNGIALFPRVDAGLYILMFNHYPKTDPCCIEVERGCTVSVRIDLDMGVKTELVQPCAMNRDPSCFVGDQPVNAIMQIHDSDYLLANKQILVLPDPPWRPNNGGDPTNLTYTLDPSSAKIQKFGATIYMMRLDGNTSAHGPALAASARAGAAGEGMATAAHMRTESQFALNNRAATPISGNVTVSMSRTETEPTEDLALWTLIRNSTEALSFTSYLHFIDGVFCDPATLEAGPAFEKYRFRQKRPMVDTLRAKRFLPFVDAEAYRVLKAATEAFVMVNCGVAGDAFDFDGDNSYLDRRDIPGGFDLQRVFQEGYLENESGINMLPYLAVLRRKLPDIGIVKPIEPDEDLCFGIIQKKLSNPCMIELIWSYWQEEGMLVQSMNAITRRFQNVRGGSADPLSNLEIDPLRPLNNLIWGYTQDEQHRLSVVRRNYEYDHHYGVRLAGRAVREFRPADSRSKFLEAFHFLLRLCSAFFRQDDDTTVKADAFPVLNALKEVHLILSQGAHNQFGDLPSTARVEMMMQQWLLARPEFREFLPTRIMVAYPEPWMDRVDAMKKLQEWSDTSVMHFRNLAIFGEQLLLSIRYGNWSDIYEPTPAFNWTRFWRPQIQGYIHAYRAATGVDLAGEQRDPVAEGTLPSILLRRRLEQQVRSTA
ncbi:hypothetical protein [Massilia consociata]|uniref:8-amino-7-oxononanoate synthase n=1 Tax=Massilia consociata TaxID=760117 RepID=A0ABV6FKP4_9BURK